MYSFQKKIILIPLLFVGCAGQVVQVQSTPEQAEVSFVTENQGKVVLGKTPMTIKAEEQPQLFSKGGMIEIRKESFVPEIVVLPGGDVGKLMNISIRLNELKAAETCSHASASMLAKGVAMAQQQILSKRFLEAETTLKTLVVAYPNLSVVHDLLGNLYYLQRDTRRSLESYKRSFELEPGNTYTDRMIRKLSSLNPMSDEGARR